MAEANTQPFSGKDPFSRFVMSTEAGLQKDEEAALSKRQEISARSREEYKATAERRKEVEQKEQDIPTPQVGKLEKVESPPDTKYRDPTQALGGAASLFTLIASLTTRTPMVAALNSAAATMEGFHQGDKEVIERQRTIFKDNMDKAIANNKTELEQYEAAIKSANFDLHKAQGAVSAIAAQQNDNVILAASEIGDVKAWSDVIKERRKGMERLEVARMRWMEHTDRMVDMRQRHEENLAFRKEQAAFKIEEKAKVDAAKAVASGKPTERAMELIDQMEAILVTKFGVTGAAGMLRRPLESISSMFTDEPGAAHQYESMARELQNILRQTEEFRYKGRTLAKEVADRDVMVRGLKFGDTGQISLDQLQHLRNMLTGQGASYEGAPDAALPPDGEPKSSVMQEADKILGIK